MLLRSTLVAAVLATAAAMALPAHALTCYLVLDRNDNVVYQDIFPPVDLSEAGAAERKAMRARNEHMIAMETDRCPRLEFVAGATGGGRISFDNVQVESASPAASAPAPRRTPPPKRPAPVPPS
jgi:hypothetical protein